MCEGAGGERQESSQSGGAIQGSRSVTVPNTRNKQLMANRVFKTVWIIVILVALASALFCLAFIYSFRLPMMLQT